MQSPVIESCPEGEAIRAIASDGTVTCTNQVKDTADQQVFVEYGRRECSTGFTVYSGFVAGGRYEQSGSGSNLLCMHPDPEYRELAFSTGNQEGGWLWTSEYQIDGETALGDAFVQLENDEVPCAVCAVEVQHVVTVPGRYDCGGDDAGLTSFYSGYLFANRAGHRVRVHERPSRAH